MIIVWHMGGILEIGVKKLKYIYHAASIVKSVSILISAIHTLTHFNMSDTITNHNNDSNNSPNDSPNDSEKKTWKGDELREIEKQIQEVWRVDNVHRTRIVPHKNEQTYFATFPYPYMNGYLHLGHGFTMSKYDFACRFYRQMGYDVLQPFSFHLTGMPIMAAVDKLRHDIQTIDSMNSAGRMNSSEVCLPVDSQYSIMKMMGHDDIEIRKFLDPRYWSTFYPEAAKQTLQKFGISYDSSRSFVTTEFDPFYDRFVKWQFGQLFKKSAVRFGTRYDLYSIKDAQPCLGHDRSSGEDAKPQKLYLIPFQLTSELVVGLDTVNDPIYVIAMTTRPETMYGATNLWIDRDGKYKVYHVTTHTVTKINDLLSSSYWICQDHNIVGLQHQYRDTDEFYIKEAVLIKEISGSELVGTTVINNITDAIERELPIIALKKQIDIKKGTGVVVSVPSESPIDYVEYMNYTSVNKHVKFRSIIQIDHDEYKGDRVAIDMIEKVKTVDKHGRINVSAKDMTIVKEFCYVKSISSSILLVGEYIGQTVLEARDAIAKDTSRCITYYEPDKEAVSRSGDRLIVAKMDQWYIDYGDRNWKKAAHRHINHMTFNDQVVKNSLCAAINWLDQWPCSRTYGLGSKFPNCIDDTGSHMIDSLSDSTIYMALYTVYHHFAEANIQPEEMTDDVFDYIFLLKYSDDMKYAKYTMMRDEFMHWYPFDLRVSAKDLIMNHLAMCIFNHVMIWDEEFGQRLAESPYATSTKSTSFGPVSYEINGYITVEKKKHRDEIKANDTSVEVEKMSKSKGNFKTLDQAIDLYTADAVRFTFASGATGTEDAFFDQELCSRMIEKLYKEKEWILAMINKIDTCDIIQQEQLRRSPDLVYCDELFVNEMAGAAKETVTNYKMLNFREVVTKGFHIMQSLRENYVEMTNGDVDPTTIKTFIEQQLSLMYPIIPHFCEYFNTVPLYCTVMRKTVPTSLALLNDVIDMDKHLLHTYVLEIVSSMTKRVYQLTNNKKKTIKTVTIFVAGEVTDPIEKLVCAMIENCNTSETTTTMTAAQIINEAQKCNVITSKKDNEKIIKYFKRAESTILKNGRKWYDDIVSGRFSEYEVLREHMKHYVKYDPSSDMYSIEGVKSGFKIKFVNYTTVSVKEFGQIDGVRINDPVIQYE